MQQSQCELPDDVFSVICGFLGAVDVANMSKALSRTIQWNTENYKREFIRRRISALRNIYNNSSDAYQRLYTMVTHGTYSFEQFWRGGSLANVSVPGHMAKMDRETIDSNPYIVNRYPLMYTYRLSRLADIAKGFIIKGTNMRSIQINIGDQIVWKTNIYGCKDCVWIQPFDIGILMAALEFQCVYIQIDADMVNECTCKYLFLTQSDTRGLKYRSLNFSYISPANLPITKPGAQLHGRYRLHYSQGMISLHYDGPSRFLI